jgi:hypothetical protein
MKCRNKLMFYKFRKNDYTIENTNLFKVMKIFYEKKILNSSKIFTLNQVNDFENVSEDYLLHMITM